MGSVNLNRGAAEFQDIGVTLLKTLLCALPVFCATLMQMMSAMPRALTPARLTWGP